MFILTLQMYEEFGQSLTTRVLQQTRYLDSDPNFLTVAHQRIEKNVGYVRDFRQGKKSRGCTSCLTEALLLLWNLLQTIDKDRDKRQGNVRDFVILCKAPLFSVE